MKRLFFTLIMGSSLGLWAHTHEPSLSNESLAEQSVVQEDAAFKQPVSNSLERMASLHLKHHHSSSDKDSGSMGPTGPQGPEGLQGPQGPNGILSLAYGSIFTEEVDTVEDNNPVEFTNETEASTTNLRLNSDNLMIGSGGSLLIMEPGDYVVMYGYSIIVNSTFSSRFVLSLNGIQVPGSNINISNVGQIGTISTIMHVSEPNSTLRLINNSVNFQGVTSSEIIGPNFGGDISAFITLEKLHNPETP